MRQSSIHAALVAVLLSWSAVAWAEPESSKAPKASVVAIMNDAGQALLLDRDKGEYVVVRVGDRFHEFRVTSIDPDQVVLTRRGTRDHFILPRTSDTSELGAKKQPAAPQTAEPRAAAPGSARDRSVELLDPYPQPKVEAPSAAGIGDLDMLDPYGTTGPITTVVAPKKKPKTSTTSTTSTTLATSGQASAPLGKPLDPYSASSAPSGGQVSGPLDPYAASPAPSGGQVSGPLDPYASSPAAPRSGGVLMDPYAPASAPASGDAPIDPYAAAGKKPSARPGKVISSRHRISRREFDEAVADFDALGKTVQFSLVPEGVRVDGIGKGSPFHRWGFESGDVIMSVDGKPIRGVDDAAVVYAHLMDATKFRVVVRRGADTVNMDFRFKK